MFGSRKNKDGQEDDNKSSSSSSWNFGKLREAIKNKKSRKNSPQNQPPQQAESSQPSQPAAQESGKTFAKPIRAQTFQSFFTEDSTASTEKDARAFHDGLHTWLAYYHTSAILHTLPDEIKPTSDQIVKAIVGTATMAGQIPPVPGASFVSLGATALGTIIQKGQSIAQESSAKRVNCFFPSDPESLQRFNKDIVQQVKQITSAFDKTKNVDILHILGQQSTFEHAKQHAKEILSLITTFRTPDSPNPGTTAAENVVTMGMASVAKHSSDSWLEKTSHQKQQYFVRHYLDFCNARLQPKQQLYPTLHLQECQGDPQKMDLWNHLQLHVPPPSNPIDSATPVVQEGTDARYEIKRGEGIWGARLLIDGIPMDAKGGFSKVPFEKTSGLTKTATQIDRVFFKSLIKDIELGPLHESPRESEESQKRASQEEARSSKQLLQPPSGRRGSYSSVLTDHTEALHPSTSRTPSMGR